MLSDDGCVECGDALDLESVSGVCSACIANEDTGPARTRQQLAQAVRDYDRASSPVAFPSERADGGSMKSTTHPQEATMSAIECPNPVVKTTHLRAYPQWIVREYADGQFDAAHMHGVAVSGGLDSFSAAVSYARSMASLSSAPRTAREISYQANLDRRARGERLS